jgi:tungstate transport system substrate-binding protein
MVKLNLGFKSLILVVIIITSIPILGLLISFLNDSPRVLTLATTTSTDNSGLLEYLHEKMKNDTDIEIDIVAVGTGAALEQARLGLADVVMVHARSLEDQFTGEGYGVHRIDLMYNDFILVGPKNDPALIKGMVNVTEIFLRLYEKRQEINFFSRGDNSGTHIRELVMWELAGIKILDDIDWAQNNTWYLETGSGMGSTLTTASESDAYTLTDRATYLFMQDNLQLDILAQGSNPDTLWRNTYGVILVNPEKFETGSIRFDLAKEYVKWLISSPGQNFINEYKIKENQVFFADFLNHINELTAEELEFWGIY